MRKRCALAALIGASLIGASPPPDDLSGWWKATVHHAGESDDIYLHFQTRGAKQIVSFSIPSVATDDYPMSIYSASPDEVNLKSIGWVLKRAPDGSLRGTLSRQLVPAYDFPAIFRRSEAPKLLEPARAAGRAPTPLWTRSLGGAVYGDIIFDRATNHLLVGTTAGDVIALNPATGRIAWTTPVKAGVRAAPVVSAGAIFVATDDAAVKLGRRTGRVLWSAAIGKPLKPFLPDADLSNPDARWDHYSAAPVVSRGVVYVGSRDGCVHSFSAADGSKVRDYCNEDEITGTPVIDGARLYYPSFDGNVYAVRLSDGRIIWKRDTHGAVPRDLTLSGRLLLAPSRSYDLAAIDKRNGARAWTRHFWWGWVDSVPEVHRRDLLIGSSDAQRVYDLDLAGGHPIWRTFLGGLAWAKPTRSQTTVYAGLIGTEQRYVGKRRGGLAALDSTTGRLKWLFEAAHGANDALYGFAAAPLAVGGRLFAADLNGTLFAFDAR